MHVSFNKRYDLGIKWLWLRNSTEADEKDEQSKHELLSVLCSNVALAHMERGGRGNADKDALTRAKEAIRHAEAVVDDEARRSRLSKACFVAGKAANKLKQFEQANEFYKRSLALKPCQKTTAAVVLNQRHAAEWRTKERTLMQKMFKGVSNSNTRGESDKENDVPAVVPEKDEFDAVRSRCLSLSVHLVDNL